VDRLAPRRFSILRSVIVQCIGRSMSDPSSATGTADTNTDGGSSSGSKRSNPTDDSDNGSAKKSSDQARRYPGRQYDLIARYHTLNENGLEVNREFRKNIFHDEMLNVADPNIIDMSTYQVGTGLNQYNVESSKKPSQNDKIGQHIFKYGLKKLGWKWYKGSGDASYIIRAPGLTAKDGVTKFDIEEIGEMCSYPDPNFVPDPKNPTFPSDNTGFKKLVAVAQFIRDASLDESSSVSEDHTIAQAKARAATASIEELNGIMTFCYLSAQQGWTRVPSAVTEGEVIILADGCNPDTSAEGGTMYSGYRALGEAYNAVALCVESHCTDGKETFRLLVDKANQAKKQAEDSSGNGTAPSHASATVTANSSSSIISHPMTEVELPSMNAAARVSLSPSSASAGARSTNPQAMSTESPGSSRGSDSTTLTSTATSGGVASGGGKPSSTVLANRNADRAPPSPSPIASAATRGTNALATSTASPGSPDGSTNGASTGSDPSSTVAVNSSNGADPTTAAFHALQEAMQEQIDASVKEKVHEEKEKYRNAIAEERAKHRNAIAEERAKHRDAIAKEKAKHRRMKEALEKEKERRRKLASDLLKE